MNIVDKKHITGVVSSQDLPQVQEQVVEPVLPTMLPPDIQESCSSSEEVVY